MKGLRDRLAEFGNRDERPLTEVWDELVSTLPQGVRQWFETKIEEEIARDQSTPPRVAIIGKSGVGKSLTINALFGTKLPVDHVVPCTKEEIALAVAGSLVAGGTGDLIVYDMPGLGEDEEVDKVHRETYRRVVSECDVAVWVISAVDRALAFDQAMIRDVVVASQESLISKLVVGLNQVDLIQPGHWRSAPNLPSKTQANSIKRKVDEVRSKFLRVVPGLTEDRIVPYSALRRYRLPALFDALNSACSPTRRWVLEDRRSLAEFGELVDPQIWKLMQEALQRSGARGDPDD